MAKTKTVKQEAWGVFWKNGKRLVISDLFFCVCRTVEEANFVRGKDKTETVRPVTLVWEVEE